MTGDRQGAGQAVEYTYDEKNAVLAFLQRPRILLILLGAWSVVGVLPQVFTDNDVFANVDDVGGLLGGLALGWSGVALAALYFYCARNPERYPRIFWLALIQLGALCLSMLFNLVAGPLSFENVVVPLAVSGFLLFLVLVNLFGEEEEHQSQAGKPGG
jgi:hypothetical protein